MSPTETIGRVSKLLQRNDDSHDAVYGVRDIWTATADAYAGSLRPAARSSVEGRRTLPPTTQPLSSPLLWSSPLSPLPGGPIAKTNAYFTNGRKEARLSLRNSKEN